MRWKDQHFLQCRHKLQENDNTDGCKYNGFAISLVWAQLHFLASTNMTETPSSQAGRLYVMLPHAVLHVTSARARLSLSPLLWLRLHLPSPSQVSSDPILSSNIPHFLQKAPTVSTQPAHHRLELTVSYKNNEVNKTEKSWRMGKKNIDLRRVLKDYCAFITVASLFTKKPIGPQIWQKVILFYTSTYCDKANLKWSWDSYCFSSLLASFV